MRIDWDVPIPMDDGIVLRADVFRPDDGGRYPVIMTYGPYGKWLAFQDGFERQWANLKTEHPDALAGSSGLQMNWETVDPEKWVPAGYAVIRVDSRGAGRSPGHLDIFSPRESRDYYLCIEWAAAEPWCTGKVGLRRPGRRSADAQRSHHLHTRGNFEGYARAASTSKWLEVHGLQHWVEFYTDYGVRLQKRFFGRFSSW